MFIGRDYQTKNDFSEKLAAEADDEVRAILDYNYKRARKLLNDNVSLLNEMAALLLDKETINKDEVDMLMQGKSAKEISEFMEKRDKEQREKEAQIRKAQAEEQRKLMLEKKLQEGEKLLANGIITQEEFDAIKKAYMEEPNPENKQENVEEELNKGLEIVIPEKRQETKSDDINNNKELEIKDLTLDGTQETKTTEEKTKTKKKLSDKLKVTKQDKTDKQNKENKTDKKGE